MASKVIKARPRDFGTTFNVDGTKQFTKLDMIAWAETFGREVTHCANFLDNPEIIFATDGSGRIHNVAQHLDGSIERSICIPHNLFSRSHLVRQRAGLGEEGVEISGGAQLVGEHPPHAGQGEDLAELLVEVSVAVEQAGEGLQAGLQPGLVELGGAYRRYLDTARKSEVYAMFAEIRSKEEAYRAEFSSYLALSATDIDGTIASYTIGSLPANGTLYADAGLTTVVTAGATVTGATLYFVPNANWNGSTGFNYTATDNGGLVSSSAAASSAAQLIEMMASLEIMYNSGVQCTPEVTMTGCLSLRAASACQFSVPSSVRPKRLRRSTRSRKPLPTSSSRRHRFATSHSTSAPPSRTSKSKRCPA